MKKHMYKPVGVYDPESHLANPESLWEVCQAYGINRRFLSLLATGGAGGCSSSL